MVYEHATLRERTVPQTPAIDYDVPTRIDPFPKRRHPTVDLDAPGQDNPLHLTP
jgi:hypothetical protein